MPKILIVVMIIQYAWFLALKTTETFEFWIIDLFLYIMFFIQSIALLAIIFLYINGDNEENMSEKVQNIVNLLTNLIILLFVMILSINILRFYFIDLF